MLSPVRLSACLSVTWVQQSTRSQGVASIADRLPDSTFGGHLTSSVTQPFDTSCHFLLVVLWNGIYLQPFSKYCAVSVLESRVWPFKVTWRHRLRDHSIAHMPFPIGGPLEPASVTVSEIFNVECNAMFDMTLIRPLNKGQVHSFWYHSISHIRLPIGCQ